MRSIRRSISSSKLKAVNERMTSWLRTNPTVFATTRRYLRSVSLAASASVRFGTVRRLR
jgi:hypothetical protein